MGRKPIPYSVLRAEGRKSQSRKVTHTEDDDKPSMPDDMADAAQTMWLHIMTHRGDFVSKADGPCLRALCEVWAMMRDVHSQLVDDPSNKTARVAYCSYAAQFDKLQKRFGLTPVDRLRFEDPAPPMDSLTAKYLR